MLAASTVLPLNSFAFGADKKLKVALVLAITAKKIRQCKSIQLRGKIIANLLCKMIVSSRLYCCVFIKAVHETCIVGDYRNLLISQCPLSFI